MRNNRILLFLFFTFTFSFSNAQTWLWGKQGIAYRNGEGYSVATAPKGDVFLTGYFSDTLYFDTIKLYSFAGEGFLVKYDSNGNVKWAIQSLPYSPSHGWGYFFSVVADKEGNSYISGICEDTIIFGSFIISTPNSENLFVAKIDPNGIVKWVQHNGIVSTRHLAYGNSIAIDTSGSVYVTGGFEDTITIGSTTLHTLGGLPDLLVIKYDSSGNVIWAKQSTYYNSGECSGQGITVDKWDNIYITGLFKDTVSFASGITIVDNSLGEDMFLVKYDSSGNVKWARQGVPSSSGTIGDLGYSVATDKSGNPIFTGVFLDTVYFDTIKLISNIARLGDIFLVEYDTSGRVLWAKAPVLLDDKSWYGYSVATDNSNHIYLAGGKGGTSYDSAKIQFGSLVLSLNVAKDAYVIIECDSLGNALCGSMLPSGGDDQGGLAIDPTGRFRYIGEDIWGDTLICGSDTLIALSGSEAPYIARWQPCVTNNLQASAYVIAGSNCSGDGSATATPIGGNPPFTYSWNPGGQTTATATGLSAGTYTVTITDSNGSTAIASVTITVPPQLTASINIINYISCFKANDGSIITLPSGGTLPYTYSWSPGGGTNVGKTGLSAGNYDVTVTDSNGCEATAAILLTQPPGMVITYSSVAQNGICDGEASVTVISGGASPYTYMWITGGQTTDTITGQCAGTYCCIVTDNSGCYRTICVTIIDATGVDNIEVGTSQITIFPNPNDGTFTLSLSNVNKKCNIEVYNILGEQVLNETLRSAQGDNLIDIRERSSGVYFYRVIKEDGSLIGEGKIVLEK